MARYKEKSYIPMIKFPTISSKDVIKNEILGVIRDIIRIQLSIKGDIYIAINYMLSELIDNITEHSSSEYGYIFAQYYPSKKYIDICIADTGITLLGSYRKANRLGIINDVGAMRQAIQGVSTKNLPDAENRGYGIVTSKNMLTEGLKGQFFMFSGGAFYRKTENEEVIYELPDTIKWSGTVVLLRIPYSYNSNFNYIDYMEG
jgi:anti-sigma regulatory factor (Ser/Thr protein kinase)